MTRFIGRRLASPSYLNLFTPHWFHQIPLSPTQQRDPGPYKPRGGCLDCSPGNHKASHSSPHINQLTIQLYHLLNFSLSSFFAKILLIQIFFLFFRLWIISETISSDIQLYRDSTVWEECGGISLSPPVSFIPAVLLCMDGLGSEWSAPFLDWNKGDHLRVFEVSCAAMWCVAVLIMNRIRLWQQTSDSASVRWKVRL